MLLWDVIDAERLFLTSPDGETDLRDRVHARVLPNQSGTYTLTARNQVGETSATVHIEVNLGSEVQSSETGTTQPILTGMEDLELGGLYVMSILGAIFLVVGIPLIAIGIIALYWFARR